MFKARFAAVIPLSLILAAPSIAGPAEDAAAAYRSGDYETALRLFRELADHGQANAQYNVGVMYAKGRGAPQNDAEALQWFRRAAAQGYAAAQFNLGAEYARGQGVPQNYTEAAKWYEKAASQGFAAAQFNLGGMYGRGEGVPKDPVQGYMWLDLAAAQGDANAAKTRDSIALHMTAEQIAEAQKLARARKPKQ